MIAPRLIRALLMTLILSSASLSCDEGGGLLALGSFEKSFPVALDPVKVPAVSMEALLDERTIRAMLSSLGYDLAELERASADFSSPDSVARAAARIGRPLEARDAELRRLLEGAAEEFAALTLSEPDSGLHITMDFSALRDVPIDYGELERSLRALHGELRVSIHIEQELASLDALLADDAELLSLLESGLLESIRVEEIGVRTLTEGERQRLEAGEKISASLRDERLIEGCAETTQPMMEGLRGVHVKLETCPPAEPESSQNLESEEPGAEPAGEAPPEPRPLSCARSFDEDAPAFSLVDLELAGDRSFCAVHIKAPSPELIELFGADRRLVLRVEVAASLPDAPLDLGGFLWIRGGTALLGVANL